MELEADGLGAQYLARAGYDPTAMIQVVRVLKNQEDFAREEAARNGQAVQAGGYHGLFDTHPDNDRRLQEVVGPARQLANGQQEVGREVFLRHLEGMPFGDSASAGVRRGQNFYHAELDFTLSYPAGWKILNQPSALLGYPADEQSFIGMKLVPHDSRLTPAEFLRKNAGQRLAQEESLKQAGLNGYGGGARQPGATGCCDLPGRPRLPVRRRGQGRFPGDPGRPLPQRDPQLPSAARRSGLWRSRDACIWCRSRRADAGAIGGWRRGVIE